MRRFVVVSLMVAAFLMGSIFARAQISNDPDVKAIQNQIDALNGQLGQKNVDYQKLNTQLDGIKASLISLGQQIVKKEQEVIQGEKTLEYQKNLLNVRAKSYYKNISKSSDSLLTLLVSPDLSRSLDNFFYQKKVVDDDRDTIVKIVLYIKNLEEKKASLQSEKVGLASLQVQVDKETQALAGEINSIKQQIATLSAQQQSIIAAKQASLNLPRSAYTSTAGCVDDREKDPGFSPRLAFFTYGVPNRIGLNQYGAWGRAKAGQSAEQILQAYYPGSTLKKDYDTGATINVDGYSAYNVEDYVKRIYEMPDSWTDNGNAALMAQAVAARSYGLAHRGGICATDSCQVFKPDPKGGNWDSAVSATAGWVLVDGGGNPISTQYSSTHGGYILNLNQFDGTGGNPGSFADLQARAYDKDSPWFYCDWGARGGYGNTAWLKSDEVADIVNVLMLAKRDASVGNHLYQTDSSNPAGTDTWSADRVKQELRSRGGSPYNSVSDVSVSPDFGSGRVSSVNVNGDAGSNSFSGSEFKDWFNLRAPANIQIVGPLFNIEKR